jgi:hypothetical protein
VRNLAGPHFINVDLEVWSREDLAAFSDALGSKAVILYAGRIRRRFLVSLEAKLSRLSSPERTIWILLKLIGSLPPPAQKAWNRAESRVFNVGYDGGEFVTLLQERPVGSGRWYPRNGGKVAEPYQSSFSPDLLHAVANVGGTITTTIYPPTKQVASRPTRRGSPTRHV